MVWRRKRTRARWRLVFARRYVFSAAFARVCDAAARQLLLGTELSADQGAQSVARTPGARDRSVVRDDFPRGAAVFDGLGLPDGGAAGGVSRDFPRRMETGRDYRPFRLGGNAAAERRAAVHDREHLGLPHAILRDPDSGVAGGAWTAQSRGENLDVLRARAGWGGDPRAFQLARAPVRSGRNGDAAVLGVFHGPDSVAGKKRNSPPTARSRLH